MKGPGPRRSTILSAVSAIAALVLASPDARASDVIQSCSDCPVGLHERALLARHLRQYDLVFEGTFVRCDSVRSGYERGRPLATFKVGRLLRGMLGSRDVPMMLLDWRDQPKPNTPVLAWVLRGCSHDGYPCGYYLRLTDQRTMLWDVVDSEWRREATLLSCDSLEKDVSLAPDSTGLDAFDDVGAVGLARLEINDAHNPPRGGLPRSGFPDNGGTWPVMEFRWVLGAEATHPRFVRFPWTPWSSIGVSVRADDRFLIPLSPGTSSDTLVVTTRWRLMLVRGGEAVGFGIPADSLPSLYERAGAEYRLKRSHVP